MCDRSKAEVLARELAVEYYSGRQSVSHDENRLENLKTFVDNQWQSWLPQAKRILKSLMYHDN